MKIESVVLFINKFINDQQYTNVRKLMLKEWDRITEAKNYQMLNNEAKQFLTVLKEEKENHGLYSLTNNDKRVLNLLNQMVKDVNLPYAKKLFIEYWDLIHTPSAQMWLTSDARYMCETWNKNI